MALYVATVGDSTMHDGARTASGGGHMWGLCGGCCARAREPVHSSVQFRLVQLSSDLLRPVSVQLSPVRFRPA